eukprot:gb/GEZN01017526.1/.p1 GENE.gb/GEZN01017526.1/~~gb/GEZN01017526.1/.p1  ORF type:complete len:242 (-),score=46.87 gb/GEZN01017526.1/:17-742(-)
MEKIKNQRPFWKEKTILFSYLKKAGLCLIVFLLILRFLGPGPTAQSSRGTPVPTAGGLPRLQPGVEQGSGKAVSMSDLETEALQEVLKEWQPREGTADEDQRFRTFSPGEMVVDTAVGKRKGFLPIDEKRRRKKGKGKKRVDKEGTSGKHLRGENKVSDGEGEDVLPVDEDGGEDDLPRSDGNGAPAAGQRGKRGKRQKGAKRGNKHKGKKRGGKKQRVKDMTADDGEGGEEDTAFEGSVP